MNSMINAAEGATRLLLSGVHAQPMFAMTQYGLVDRIGEENMFGNIDEALEGARRIVSGPQAHK